MAFIKKEYKKFNKKSFGSFLLAGDVGGTNTSLGVFGIKNARAEFLMSFHFSSPKLKNLSEAVNEVMGYLRDERRISISKACFGIAGTITPNGDFAKVTNLNWDVDRKDLLEKTKLTQILLINDFEAIGYGINIVKEKDVFTIRKAKKIPKAPIVVIGAGTGLGKKTLIYDKHSKAYAPIPSEAGHCDFPAQAKEELELVNFVKRKEKTKASVSYEQVLSGKGLANIYSFLRKTGDYRVTKYTKEIDKSKNWPELISKYRSADKTCKAAFGIFKANYAKFAKNCALGALAYGGVYIAGGIAPKNRDIFDKRFIRIFEDNHKMQRVLKKMPIYLILNYNAGLLGAGFAGAKFLK
ncbi:glucokinase [Candidatus Woesearchaeota archaeon]|nr:glucokinase [Candidatus Woesearchaeota archaeon]